jgi:hypothetical protein
MERVTAIRIGGIKPRVPCKPNRILGNMLLHNLEELRRSTVWQSLKDLGPNQASIVWLQLRGLNSSKEIIGRNDCNSITIPVEVKLDQSSSLGLR